MKNFNNDIFGENTISPEEAVSQELRKINDETKEAHTWLNEPNLKVEVQPITIRHAPSSISAMIEGAKVKRDSTIGWLKPADGGLEVSIDVEAKLKNWLEEHGAIRLRIKKLHKTTAYNATHRCLFVGKAHTPPIVADMATRTMAIIRDTSLDDCEFSVSPETLGSFIYRWKGKVWLKLHVKNQNGSVWVYCQ